MFEESFLRFGPFRLDVTNACVWRGTEAFRLPPKAFAVLRLLITHAGQIVTKDAFLEAIWPDVVVSDAALAVCIGELRRAFGDTARAPQFIETVHRRGYRFIASVTRGGEREQHPVSMRAVRPDLPLLVGRQTELSQLHGWWSRAQRGERQVVFVTGEAGIGKTALLDAFVARLGAETPLWTARGQCIGHYGSSEAYLPVLDALSQLCREPEAECALSLLEQYAPTLMMHMPSFLSATKRSALQHRVQGVMPERMLREVGDALEALTAERPMLLVLEDLHWSDVATLDLLAWLARRRQPARLLLVGTYRPVEVIIREHALRAVKQELALHKLCAELPLELLNEAEVEQYLRLRFGQRPVPDTLARLLHQRTEGNPLFLTTLVDSLLVQDGELLDMRGDTAESLSLVPESLQGIIERHLEQCSAVERQVLDAASVAGFEFTVTTVAAGAEKADDTVEQHCATLAHRGPFLLAGGIEAWPDGTVTERYRFRHALYQQVIYDRLATSQRQRLHLRIGQQLNRQYGEQTTEHAAELAQHFESGRQGHLAIRYHQLAAANALDRRAYQETVHHLEATLRLLQTLPETPERLQHELRLQMQLGSALITTRGYSTPALKSIYTRALELCHNLEDTQQLFRTVWGLFQFHTTRGDLSRAETLADQLLTLTQCQPDATDIAIAYLAKGFALGNHGELRAAHSHLERAATLSKARQADLYVANYDFHPGVLSLARLADFLWLLGYPAQALSRSQQAHRLAQELAHPRSLVIAGFAVARQYTYRREWSSALSQAESLKTLATRQNFHWYAAWGSMLQGLALVAQGQEKEGLTWLVQGLDAYRNTDTRLSLPYALAIQAQAYGHVGDFEAGLRVLDEALEFEDVMAALYQAALYRFQGELLLRATQERHQSAPQAESCFHQALSIAQSQQAKSWELRAATSLACLWQAQGKRQEAYDLLAPVYGWFTEGFDTADLKDAKALLDELS